MMHGTPGPISRAALGGAMPMMTFASVQKLTNGFVVNYQRAMEVMPPEGRLRGSVFPPGIERDLRKGIGLVARAAAEKLGEGDEWKEKSEEDESSLIPAPVWVREPAMIVCKTEDEMIAALRDAVVESAKIEKLYREGKLGVGDSYLTLGG